MIKIADALYIDETEVDVGSWLSYYSWSIVHEGLEAAQKLLPDSSEVEPELWAYIKNKSTGYIDVQARYSLQPIGYFGKECKECAKFGSRLSSQRKFCAMLAFPITGVTYEQVKGFCEWRTKVEGNNKLVFRLPTPGEWTDFALNGLSETERKNGFRDSLNNKKCAKYNFNISCNCGNDSYQGKLNGIGMYVQEKSGAFDVFGNVSEMTTVKGIAKGGNFKLRANQCHPDSVQNYIKPQIWLGFRCIAAKSIVGNANKIPQTSITKDSSSNMNGNSNFDKFTDPRDNKIYPTVKIGNQTWLASNLAYKPENGKYWAYAKEQSNVDKYGYLYNWEISKEVCPVGWHLPSKDEFETLVQTIGGDGNTIYNKLIPSGSSGFAALSAGLRFDMNFTPIDGGSAFWSSTENGKKRAWGLTVGRLESKAYVDDGWYKNYGLSIRCIKDR
jgi:uncharacterized protein (TIGR02145 family)